MKRGTSDPRSTKTTDSNFTAPSDYRTYRPDKISSRSATRGTAARHERQSSRPRRFERQRGIPAVVGVRRRAAAWVSCCRCGDSVGYLLSFIVAVGSSVGAFLLFVPTRNPISVSSTCDYRISDYRISDYL